MSLGWTATSRQCCGRWRMQTATQCDCKCSSARVGQPVRTVAEVTETFLLREGLIVRTDAGRELTEKGREYAARNPA